MAGLTPFAAAAAALAVAILCGPAPAHAAADCEASEMLDLEMVLDGRDHGVEHIWGKENLTLLPKAAGTDGPVLRVEYPAGSFGGRRSAIRGGAGFELHRAAATVACLSYKVRFPAGFDFVKGGKLPGLFGGDAPRGCSADGIAEGFSARLMWREGGAGELYLYAPHRGGRCGASVGRGSWIFTPGVWTLVTQRVSANGKGSRNGSIEIWIDGRSASRSDGLALSEASSPSVDGLLFATFFGGDDESWAPPEAQYADFADIRVDLPRSLDVGD